MSEASENNSATENIFAAISSCPNITTIRGSRGTKSLNNPSLSQLSIPLASTISSSSISSSFAIKTSSNSSSISNTKASKRNAHENDNGPSNVVKKAKKEYFCPKCHKEYHYIGALFTHLKNSHGLTADEINNFHSTTVENSLIVSSSDKFKDEEKVKVQEKAPYACEFCSRVFKGEKRLLNHIGSEHRQLIESPRVHIPNAATSLDSSFYSSYTSKNNNANVLKSSKLSKSCNFCHKKYFRKHTCKKSNANSELSNAWVIFETYSPVIT
jgi:ribosomal protein L37AE/L43A